MTVKDAAIEVIRQLPDDVTAEDLLLVLSARIRIEEGLRQANAGLTIPDDEARTRLARWLA